MIRILQVLGGLERGGAETLVINLHRAIDKTKIQFDYIIHTDKPQQYTEEVKILGGKIYEFPAFSGKNYFELKKLWRQFFEKHPEYRILHSHVRSYASLYLPIAKRYGVRTIVHSHNTSNGRGISSLIKMVMQFPIRWEADYYFGCSREAGEWLFGKSIVNTERYFMLKNAVNIQKFQFNNEIRKKIRKEFDISDECLVIGTVGRLTQQKNPEKIIDICEALVKKNLLLDKFKFLWIGTGELEREINELIKNKGLENSVVMTGVRADVHHIFQALDIFILPSFWEGLPVVSVEAQAAGLPCLLADTITRDVQISELVSYLPINIGTEIWIEAILEMRKERKDVSEDIKEAGFDIEITSKWLTEFYISIL